MCWKMFVLVTVVSLMFAAACGAEDEEGANLPEGFESATQVEVAMGALPGQGAPAVHRIQYHLGSKIQLKGNTGWQDCFAEQALSSR